MFKFLIRTFTEGRYKVQGWSIYKVRGEGVYKVQGEGVYKVHGYDNFSEKGWL